MPERTRKRPRDTNQLAASVVQEATEGVPEQEPDDKNPAAVELGRMGGKKGGKARSASLSDERRKEIARKAAEARWGKS